MSLIEAMVAMGVFSGGILAVFQGIIVASRQNSVANKITTANGLAQQVRAAMQARGRTLLTATTLSAANCSADAEVQALAGGLEALAGACVIDLDALEAAALSDAARLVPNYPAAYQQGYRRVIVYFPGANLDRAEVVVSFLDLGRRHFQKQFMTFVNAATIGASVDL